ncbi:MAG: hypothetical protein VB112_09940, partial [Oscillospiraceae bacterium]|nr:hypothetical protein [Oscillospiraceae bacterium]
RAPPCQGGGSESEPRRPLHNKRIKKIKGRILKGCGLLFCNSWNVESAPSRAARLSNAVCQYYFEYQNNIDMRPGAGYNVKHFDFQSNFSPERIILL